MKNFLKKNTSLLLRIDDVAANMNWKFMDKCEALFDEMSIIPLVGVIPDNKDEELLRYFSSIQYPFIIGTLSPIKYKSN